MAYRSTSERLGIGDPGIFTSIGGFLLGTAKKVATVAFQTSPAGRILAAAQGLLVTNGSVTATSIQEQVSRPGIGLQEAGRRAQATKGGTTTIRQTSTALTVMPKKRRRMNVLNVKALRRSTRRLAGFQREAKKVEKELRKLAPQTRSRSRRDLGPHHTHVR